MVSRAATTRDLGCSYVSGEAPLAVDLHCAEVEVALGLPPGANVAAVAGVPLEDAPCLQLRGGWSGT